MFGDETGDDDESTEQCTLELTPREVKLVIKYGYPFPDDAARLRASPLRNGVHVVTIDPYWVEMWIADIVRSAKEIESDALLAQLDEVCCVLEGAPASGARRACMRLPSGSVLTCAATGRMRIFGRLPTIEGPRRATVCAQAVSCGVAVKWRTRSSSVRRAGSAG